MNIHFHISLITKQFFRSFDRHSDKTATLSELLQDINNFSKTIVDVIRKSHEFRFKIVRVITIVVSNPVIFFVNARLWRQSIASWYSMTSRFFAILLLNPPSNILYTLVYMTSGTVWRKRFHFTTFMYYNINILTNILVYYKNMNIRYTMARNNF